MNREIKFRGLRTDGKGWVYGFYCNIKDEEHYILETCVLGLVWTEVIPESIGQFTGLKDRNGKDIYEGDLVNYKTIVKTDETGENITYKGEIQFWLGQVGCGWRYKSGRYTLMMKRSHAWLMEVIGNIHEKEDNV